MRLQDWTALALLSLGSGAYAQAVPATAPVAAAPAAVPKDVDWGNLARYRAANAALGPAIDRGRVVFMGDSITQNWAKETFLTGNPHHVGRGISGQTAGQMVVRFEADVVDLHPAVVHILAGTNDVAQNRGPETSQEMQGYIRAMVDMARANKIRVVLGSVPPAADFSWRRGLEPAPKIRAFNVWLKAYAARERLIYVDYWAAMATPEGAMKPELSRDGVHPNAAGYGVMEALAQAAIARALR